ncbi:hypothetical protein [Xanthobacter autotrophicus]|uniref:hypothetical protein n=1 Tax=Xanthobacter autotrophicus TaxID=280 RepID=UPI00372BE8C5
MFTIGRITFVTAVLAGLFAVMKYLVYGISADFGLGFLAGGLLMGGVAILAAYVAEKETEERVRAELSRPERPLDL